MVGVAGDHPAGDDAPFAESTDTVLAEFIEPSADAATAVLGVYRDVGAVVPGMIDGVVLDAVFPGDVDERVTGVGKVELHEDPKPHSDRASLIEHDKVALRKSLGEHPEFVGVVEVVRTDRGEDGQLEFFERLSVLDGQGNVGEFAHRANGTFWYSFIDGKPHTAQNSFVRGRITVAPDDST